jgi:hypothetical protein
MRRTTSVFGALGAAFLLCLALAGCPIRASYGSTITPIYAATAGSGLYVYNGSSWTRYTTANGLASDTVTSVVVSGSGSGAIVFVGTNNGVSAFNGSTWQTWSAANGLGAGGVNGLFLGANLYAATAGGVSVDSYSSDYISPTWTNDATAGASSGVYVYGSYTYVAAGSLDIYNGTGSKTTIAATNIVPASAKVTAVLVDSNQNIFAGTDKGLNYLASGSAAFTLSNAVTNTGSVNGLFLDNNDNLYVAGAAGLYIWNLSSGAFGAAIGGSAVLCVYVDGAGTIYAGTASGLEISKNGGSSWTTILTTTTPVDCVVTTAPLYSF